jgi:hypothetical protein
LLALHLFTIEYSQRVPFHADTAVRTELLRVIYQELAEPRRVCSLVVLATEVVDLDNHMPQTEQVVILARKVNELEIRRRIATPYDFSAYLMVLPFPTCLRSFIPEHRSNVIQFLKRLFHVHFVLDVRANNRRRALRSQGETSPFPIRERVHLFLHDLATLARASLEQRCLFKNRHSDFSVTKPLKQVSGERLRPSPARDLLGQYVVRSSRRSHTDTFLHSSHPFSDSPRKSAP